MRSLSTGRVGVPFSARFHSARPGRHPGVRSVEGLRMSSSAFSHDPVMKTEIVAAFAPVPAGVLVDGTAGGGGHSAAILESCPQLRVVAIDQDPDAVEAATRRLEPFGERADVYRARFDRFAALLDQERISSVSGVLLDLGVSSPQLDVAARGFSYRLEAPLDMRMDREAALSAHEVVNGWTHGQLARIIADNGEGRFAGRIAAGIIAARPILTTTQLAEVVRSSLPAAVRRQGGHPAKRVFQAIRIAVNDELSVLADSLTAMVDRLTPGGRVAVLSYHSGEDRIVKQAFRHGVTGGCICPPGLDCVCGARPTLRLVRGLRATATDEEQERNPRARSARLRVAERLDCTGDVR